MKFATIALIAVVSAQDAATEEKVADVPVAAGEDCTVSMACTDATLECAWNADATMGACQDCMATSRTWEDGTMFYCIADKEKDGSMTLAASAMAFIAAATMMA